MEIIFRDKEYEHHKANAEVLRITDRDSVSYRIKQDTEKGIEMLADGLSSKILVEPRCANQIVVIGIEE